MESKLLRSIATYIQNSQRAKWISSKIFIISRLINRIKSRLNGNNDDKESIVYSSGNLFSQIYLFFPRLFGQRSFLPTFHPNNLPEAVLTLSKERLLPTFPKSYTVDSLRKSTTCSRSFAFPFFLLGGILAWLEPSVIVVRLETMGHLRRSWFKKVSNRV